MHEQHARKAAGEALLQREFRLNGDQFFCFGRAQWNQAAGAHAEQSDLLRQRHPFKAFASRFSDVGTVAHAQR